MAIDDLEPLITEEPDPLHGYPIQLEAVSGEWRFAVQLADPADPYVEWLDITQFYCGDRHQRGADQPKGRYAASVTSVQLQIDAIQAEALEVDINILAPWGQDTTSLFGVDVTLDAGLLMRAGVFSVVGGYTDEWYPLWTGRVESWGDDSTARGQIRTHVVNVVDLLSDMANVPTIVDVETNWDDWFTEQLLPAAGWLFGVDIYGDTTSTGGSQDLVPQAAINRMDAMTDGLGLVWRTRRNGKLIIYPAPWDTTNVARWTTNPLELAYPGGVVFSYAPSTSEIEYVADDEAQPFGVSRSIVGVLNSFNVTMPDTTVYSIDDPVSIGRYGVRPYTASWIVDNPPVVDDLLADRAYNSSQALPLRTQIDMEGFFPALALLDHLDPVTVVHATLEGNTTVNAVGIVRNLIDERTFRFYDGADAGALSWQTTVQMDINATEVVASLLPVEDLALVSAFTPGFGGPSGAEFSWTNPTQPSVTPTHLQVRVLGQSTIWNDIDYPGTGADGVTVNWLAAATPYTFEVRIIRRVNGIITNASPVRSINFITPANILPFPIPGDDDDTTNAEIPQPDDPCDDFEVELQESDDGVTWSTIDSFTGTELEDNGDGTYSLAVDIDNSVFDADKVYRFRSTCDGVTWTNGPSFDVPDDWTDPCTTPPALADPPFDDPALLVYVPQVCAPDIIREAVSGIEGVKGDALLGFGIHPDYPTGRTLIAIDDPVWSDTPGGILAYGECPQIVGQTGDKSVAVRVNIAAAEDCVLFECAAMTINCVALTAGWRASVTVYKSGSTITLPSTAILGEGVWYEIVASHELATGDIKLYIDGDLDNSVGGSDNVPTINALPIWRVGAPPGSAITDCAVWSTVLVFAQPFDANDWANLIWWIDPSNTASLGFSGSDVVSAQDLSPNDFDFTGTGGNVKNNDLQNNLNVFTLNGNDQINQSSGDQWTLTGKAITMFAVIKLASISEATQGLLWCKVGTSDDLRGLFMEIRTSRVAVTYGRGSPTGDFNAMQSATGVFEVGVLYVVAIAMDTSGDPTVYVNGTPVTVTNFAGGLTATNFLADSTSAIVAIHGLRSGGVTGFSGRSGDMFAYADRKDAGDIGDITDALLAKWVSPTPTGGTITESGGYTYHTFTSSGEFDPGAAAPLTVDYLVVGGGGGGGRSGGGAGGMVSGTGATISVATAVTVGAGGPGGTAATGGGAGGTAGSASSLGAIATASGGGRGINEGNGQAGGSGSGAGTNGASNYTGGAGTGGEGQNGGTAGGFHATSPLPCGGGGGKTGTGGNAPNASTGGAGGAGAEWPSGSGNYYAGGGGGAVFFGGTGGAGGQGGGGAGGTGGNGAAGTANTGGGGGGAPNGSTGGAGGSGVVIVRYVTP